MIMLKLINMIQTCSRRPYHDLLLLFMFIFSILGVQLFGRKLHNDQVDANRYTRTSSRPGCPSSLF